MSKFCGSCGNPIEGGERFCGRCGRSVAPAAPAATAPAVPQYSAPQYAQQQATASRPAGYSAPPPAPQQYAPPPPPQFRPAPPPFAPPPPQAQAAYPPPPSQTAYPPRPAQAAYPPQPAQGSQYAQTAYGQPQYAQPAYPPAAPYPAAGPAVAPGGVQPWPFQISVAAQGDSLAKSMGLTKPGQATSLWEMMFRAAFLDWNVYRQAVADTAGGQKAWTALAVPFAATALGGYLMTLSLPGFSGLFYSVAMVAVQLVGFAIAVAVMSAVSQSIVQRKLDFGRLFRPLAYAQSAGILGLLPVVGQLLGLWRIVTSLVAIREAAQCDGGKAAILLIIGGVGATLATVILAPVIYGAFRMFG